MSAMDGAKAALTTCPSASEAVVINRLGCLPDLEPDRTSLLHLVATAGEGQQACRGVIDLVRGDRGWEGWRRGGG
eukprot:760093-Hanusia_phi.AAC.5